MKKIVLLILILMIMACSNNKEGFNQEAFDYLNENKNIVSYSEYNYDDVFEENLDQYEVFFTGEEHANSANQILNFNFLRYLKEKVNIKYYLNESSYSCSFLLNKYLLSGDKEYLDYAFKVGNGGRFYTEERYQFFINLYEYNKNFLYEDKIVIVGIDTNSFSPFYALLHMVEILPQKEAPSEINSDIDSLLEINNLMLNNLDEGKTIKGGYKQVREFYEEGFLDSFEINSEIFRIYLGEEMYNEFVKILEDVKNGYIVADTDNFMVPREKFIHKNFEWNYNRLPKGKYYGQWGNSHIFQKKTMYSDVEKFIAEYINNDIPELKNKVLSIWYVYENCKFLYQDTYEIVDVDRVSDFNNSSLYDYFYSKDEKIIELYNLKKEGSPFLDNLILYDSILKYNFGGTTIDYFQYLVYIKGYESENKKEF